MIERFFPDKVVNRVEDISIEDLKQENIKGLILDVDNTIAKRKLEPTEEVKAWIEVMKKNGIKICLVSNNNRSRVEKLSKNLKVNGIHGACKPAKRAFICALKLMGTKPSETAVVGDQIFTDVYGGNRLNLYTIYVNPIAEEDYFITQIKRPFERYVLKRFKDLTFRQKQKRFLWKLRSGRRKLKELGEGETNDSF